MFVSVLGIDPGLTTTGYGIVESSGSRERAVAVGVIKTDPAAPVGRRLAELYRDLSAVIDEYRPTAAAIERIFQNRNRNTAMAAARASGVAMLAVAEAGLTIEEYTPSAVKMALVGIGDAPKEQIERVVSMRLGLARVPGPADAADALAVALCHHQHAPRRRVEAS
ncbi:MAG: crossover junction endodeoxyribonuclease RuvC [Actinobacteria bacterium]|nr:MAG: crossover junction endodeoxyribonuclease RuvC [Actinomycetota bacterium]